MRTRTIIVIRAFLRRYTRLIDLHRRLRWMFHACGLRGDYGCGQLVVLINGLLVVGTRRVEHLRYVAQLRRRTS